MTYRQSKSQRTKFRIWFQRNYRVLCLCDEIANASLSHRQIDRTIPDPDVLANRGVTIGGKGGTIAGALNNYGGAESLREAPKNPKNVISAFFNTVHLLPKDLRFEHVGARVVARMSQQGGLKITRGAHCYIQCWMYAATATKKSLVACKVHSHLFRPRKLYRYERRTC